MNSQCNLSLIAFTDPFYIFECVYTLVSGNVVAPKFFRLDSSQCKCWNTMNKTGGVCDKAGMVVYSESVWCRTTSFSLFILWRPFRNQMLPGHAAFPFNCQSAEEPSIDFSMRFVGVVEFMLFLKINKHYVLMCLGVTLSASAVETFI